MTPTLAQRRPARLRNIVVNEVSLVDKGANPFATVVMLKRTENEAPAFGSPLSRLASLAKAAARAEGTTPEQGYASALKANPTLYDAAEDARQEAHSEGSTAAAEALASFEARVEAEARALAQRTGWSRQEAYSQLMTGVTYDRYEALREAVVLDAQGAI